MRTRPAYSQAVAAAEDPSTRWETLPNFRERAGVERYQAPPANSHDPVVVHGPLPKHDMSRRMVQTVMIGISCALPTYTLTPHSWPYFLLPAGVLLVVPAIGYLRVRLPRSWQAPSLVANDEGLTVRDARGSVSSALWQDISAISVRATKDRDLPTVTVVWANTTGGYTAADLGHTVNLQEIDHAIRSRAPSAIEITLVPRKVLSFDMPMRQ